MYIYTSVYTLSVTSVTMFVRDLLEIVNISGPSCTEILIVLGLS